MIYSHLAPVDDEPIKLHVFEWKRTTGDVGRLGRTCAEMEDDIASYLIPITPFRISFKIYNNFHTSGKGDRII